MLWARIKAIVNLTLLSIAAGIPDNGGCFELFGYDVMVDDALRPWLLEVNLAPSLAAESPLDLKVSPSLPTPSHTFSHLPTCRPSGLSGRAGRARSATSTPP